MGGVGSIDRVVGGDGEARGIVKGGGSVLVNYYDLFKKMILYVN